MSIGENKILKILREEKEARVKGGLYHRTQILFTYNSNHIEGSRLTEEQTRYIFETNTIGTEGGAVNVDDIIEAVNHFRCIDYAIDAAEKNLSEEIVKKLHGILKNGASDGRLDWFAVGDYKKRPNVVGGEETAPPEAVSEAVGKLISSYLKKSQIKFEDIVEFHRDFEKIHPFQDGNGRVGRLISFKECLKNGLTPFIIDEKLKFFYYRGLKEWPRERGYLLETCKAGREKYERVIGYFLKE
jgi:Uncharacterized conserved protein